METVVKIAFLGLSAILGAAAGWWIRGTGGNRQTSSTPEQEPSETPAPDYGTVDTMMAQLQQLTASMASDVGEHNTKVKAINEELNAAQDGSSVISIVQRLVKTNETMQSQLAQAEERLQEQAREIEAHVQEARTDALTKVWNRRHFDDELRKCLEAFQNSQRPTSVMMLDVDHFKKFNDTYGHQAGDEVLRGVARTLQKHVGPQDIVCRYGGEEFGVIFPGSDIEASIPSAERARSAIADRVFEFEGLELKVSASGGLAQFRQQESVEDLIKRSDSSLYFSKQAGRNCGHWHDGKTSHRMELPKPKPSQQAPSTTPNSQAEATGQELERLPGVSSRQGFMTDVDRRIAELKRGGSALSVMLIEIDQFAALQQAHGVKATGVVLRAAAQFLKAAMREMDHIGRFDEHTFGLLLPGADMTAAKSVAERLLAAIARCQLPLGGQKLTFTISVGAAQAVAGQDRQELLARAEASLEAARESGGNCSFATMPSGEVRSMVLSS